ncbi:hypothetical protein VCRA2126O85_430041 [Vibrio crassostreae]|nr:hypothetical protein VCRA2128O106_420006 [Vibrio crassostreae]CAK2955840.1 hypothetical protein VCRA2125O83_420006 [Vibrio crassostreae]CAK2957241.1 hypothetical protein VCRA2128O100_440006 [Vibrio crassostreae]CAK2959186.1 hypothetical protein VCRA2127O91_430006 [Vibrio crassostreae]CAK2961501.1 hypothetical protein VCRA2126O86_430042 [Vibrio crassostreae]
MLAPAQDIQHMALSIPLPSNVPLTPEYMSSLPCFNHSF